MKKCSKCSQETKNRMLCNTCISNDVLPSQRRTSNVYEEVNPFSQDPNAVYSEPNIEMTDFAKVAEMEKERTSLPRSAHSPSNSPSSSPTTHPKFRRLSVDHIGETETDRGRVTYLNIASGDEPFNLEKASSYWGFTWCWGGSSLFDWQAWKTYGRRRIATLAITSIVIGGVIGGVFASSSGSSSTSSSTMLPPTAAPNMGNCTYAEGVNASYGQLQGNLTSIGNSLSIPGLDPTVCTLINTVVNNTVSALMAGGFNCWENVKTQLMPLAGSMVALNMDNIQQVISALQQYCFSTNTTPTPTMTSVMSTTSTPQTAMTTTTSPMTPQPTIVSSTTTTTQAGTTTVQTSLAPTSTPSTITSTVTSSSPTTIEVSSTSTVMTSTGETTTLMPGTSLTVPTGSTTIITTQPTFSTTVFVSSDTTVTIQSSTTTTGAPVDTTVFSTTSTSTSVSSSKPTSTTMGRTPKPTPSTVHGRR